MARRRTSVAHKKVLARKRQARYRWGKKTSKTGKYSHLGAVIRRRPGRRKHVQGHSWTGRKGTVALFNRKTGRLWGTNPIGKTVSGMIISPVMALPRAIPALLKQHPVRNIGFAAGGGIVGLMGGTALQQLVMNLLNKVAPAAIAPIMSNGIAQRVIGASFALLAGGLAGKIAVKKPADRLAFVTGTAAAAIAEAFFPGALASKIAQLPIVGQYMILPASPVRGLMGMYGSDELAAYVEAPAYQGVGAYVEAPAYQGVGASMDDAVAGLGSGDYLAGNLGSMGSNMPSHLDS